MFGPRIVSRIATGFVGALVCTAALARNHSDFAVTTDAAKVKHVFMIVLENKNYSDTFGTSTQDPYLQKTLVPMGALLTEYYGTGHVSLDNYISMISGQAPTPDTDDDCLPGLGMRPTERQLQRREDRRLAAPQGQVVANGGCVYPRTCQTLADQLRGGLSWKGYMEDMGNDPARESATCGHPPSASAPITPTPPKPQRRRAAGRCLCHAAQSVRLFPLDHRLADLQDHVVNLNALTHDLARERTTPNFVFITPNLCNDGHDGDGTGAAGKACANGQPGGLTSADAFLQDMGAEDHGFAGI